MKVAASLANLISDGTSLPSLLSSEADVLSAFPNVPTLPAEIPTNDLTPADTVSAFDAVMAMFGPPQNLPQPSNSFVSTPLIRHTSEATAVTNQLFRTHPDGIRLEPAANDLSSNDVAANFVTNSRTLPPGLESTRQPQIQSPLPIIEPQHPALFIAAASAPTATTDSRISERPNLQPTPIANSQPSSAASQSIPLETSRPAAHSQTNTTLPAFELPSSGFKHQHSHNQRKGESKWHDGQASMPTLATSTDVSELPLQLEIREPFTRFVEPQVSTTEAKSNRDRHEQVDARAVGEHVGIAQQLAESATHSAKPLDTQSLTEQISAAMQTHGDELSAGKPIELQLRLDPPELGVVRVHLRLTDESVSIHFIAGDEAVTRLLESQLPDLRQSLAERGLAFTQCDVQCGGQHQSSSGSRQDADQLTFAPKRLAPRVWPKPLPAHRPINVRNAHLDVLA